MKAWILTALLAFGSLSISAQTVKWTFDTHDESFGQTAAADLDGDGKLELVFSCYWNDSNVYVLNAEDGSLKWKHNLGGCNDAGPLIADVDGNGSLEVIVASSCNPITTCFNADGSIKWQTPTGGSDSPPTIGDIDNDGQLEILHGQFNGKVICLNAATGSVEWDLLVDADAAIETEPALLDADGDGHLDFIVATWNLANADSNRIYCYKGSDHSLMWSNNAPHDIMYHGPAFGDIDHDGKMEITLGDYSAHLFCINAENGSISWKDSIPGLYNYIGAPTTLADLDTDGYLDVVYCDDYHVGAKKYDGGDLWEYTIPNYGTAFRGAAVADVNNDQIPDVTFGTSEGALISLDGLHGTVIRSMDLRAVYADTFEIDHAPVIADFDNDGTLDVFIQGGKTRYPNIEVNYGRAYCLSWGAGNGPDWTMFRRDVNRSACLCNAAGLPLAIPDAVAIKSDFSIYPNPGNGIETVSCDTKGQLQISDLSGKILVSLELTAAQNRQLDLSTLDNGLYIYKFSVQGRPVATGKLNLLR